MEKNMQTEPEVLTGPTEIICSTSIELVILGEYATLTLIDMTNQKNNGLIVHPIEFQ
jgi:hypothetical protein